MLIDTHCHIQFAAYKDDADVVIQKCVDADMLLNCVGSQLSTSQRAVEYAHKYPNIFATVGLHPVHLFATEVDEGEEVSFTSRAEVFDHAAYAVLAQDPKTIAIGECGLELYHLPKNVDREKLLQTQKETFLAQYNLAQEYNLPLVIHVRDAHSEMISLLKTLLAPINGVVHCYTGNWTEAQEYLALGLHIGFTGVVTFPPKKTDPKPQEELLEVVRNVPPDRILIETDAPYLAPQAYRGERCEPWMVREVAKKLATERNMTVEEVIAVTTANAKRLFTTMVI